MKTKSFTILNAQQLLSVRGGGLDGLLTSKVTSNIPKSNRPGEGIPKPPVNNSGLLSAFLNSL